MASSSAVGALVLSLIGVLVAASATAAPPGVEPIFERSQVVGSVFCDVDGNGRHGLGELGVGGVRIAADTGDEVSSDLRGRWHLRRFDAGEHLLKLDETTLPPWASSAGSPRRRLAVSGGLEVRIDFPLTCVLETVSPAPEEPDPEAAVDAAALVTVAGTLEPAAVAVDARPLKMASAHLLIQGSGLEPPGASLNIPWAPGALLEPLVFLPAGKVDVAERASWRLVITRVRKDGEVPVRELFGSGAAPERLLWDGTDPEGLQSILERGGLYRARLRVTDGFGGLAVSDAVTFGVSYGSSDTVLEHRLLRGELFDERMEPKKGFWRGVRGLKRVVHGNVGSRLLIEVHTADDDASEITLIQSRKAAFLLGEALAGKLKIDASRVLSLGFGSTRPVAPNVNDTNRQLNRRVAITVLPPEEFPLPPVPVPRFKPQAHVQGVQVEIGQDFSFIQSVARPVGGAVAIDLTLPTGMRWQALVDLDSLPAIPKEAAVERDPHRFFGGPGLRKALDDELVVDDSEPADTARILDVVLPAADGVLQAPQAFVTGTTHPSNKVTINGRSAAVDRDTGRFAGVVPLKVGADRIVVETTDGGGRKASVSRDTMVAEMQFFVLALGDAGLGELDAHIDGRSDTTGGAVGPVFLHGRAAAYFKGRISGTFLAEHLEITAHLDTAKRPGAESFWEQIIDPSRDYALFGDTASDTQGARARGPLYVLVEADRSKLIAGDFRAGLEGIEILRYDRALYGGLVHFERAFAEGFDTTVRAFVSEDNSRLVRGHDELRATGGSLYYLSRNPIVEGSEKLVVVVRETDTRFELGRSELVRDRDYRIDYRDGRILLTAPLSSWSASVWDVSSFQPGTRRSVWGGHEVWLVADYEANGSEGGQVAGGVYARQKLFDRVEVGAGYIHESKKGADYQLWGGHVAADIWEGNRITAEIAGSRGVDGTSMLSHDGGLRYGLLDRALGRDHGLALKLTLDSRPGEFFEDLDLDLRVRAWWQYAEVGFRSAGYAQDAGTERFGGEVIYRPTENDDVRVRFDGTTLIEGGDDSFIGGVRSVRRLRWAARYQRYIGPLTLRAEAVYGQSRDDDDGKVQHSGGVVVGASWHVIEPLVLHLSQELLISDDEELVGDRPWSGLGTRIGVDWRFTEDLSLSFGHLFRWDGDHAFRVGVRSQVDDHTSVYLEERIASGDRAGDLVGATVLGAEHRFDETGRAYGEYRIDGGIDGRSNRAVVGIGKRFDLAPGVSMSAGYERTESFGGGFEGRGSRDVLSIGFELLTLERLKLSGRYELRVDVERSPGVDDPDAATFVPRELVQAVALNSATLSITEDLTAMGIVNYMLTQDLRSRRVERETLEAAVSLIWRPRSVDWLTLAGRYGRYHSRWLLPGATTTKRETVDLFSVAGHMELPFRIQLTPKIAFRHRTTVGLGFGTAYEILWALRAAVDLYAGLDVATEYRLLADIGFDVHHGALLEVGYTLFDHARIALGYDFNDIPRELTPGGQTGRGGVYFRVTGRY